MSVQIHEQPEEEEVDYMKGAMDGSDDDQDVCYQLNIEFDEALDVSEESATIEININETIFDLTKKIYTEHFTTLFLQNHVADALKDQIKLYKKNKVIKVVESNSKFPQN